MKHRGHILALLLALALLTGCASGNAPATTAPAETTLPIETTQPVETTLPAETVAATEPTATEPVMVQLELTEQERYEINIFLSNFTEQQFRDTYWYPWQEGGLFRSSDADIYEILYFTWHNLKYNTREGREVKYDGAYYTGIPLDTVNARSLRFFGRSLTEEDVEQAGRDFLMIDGMVCYPEAWGDTYLEMAIIDALYDLGDGTMLAVFTVYEPTLEAEYDGVTSAGGINEKFVYYYLPEEAVSSGYFTPYCEATAQVKPKTLDNGRESYELVTYELLEKLG